MFALILFGALSSFDRTVMVRGVVAPSLGVARVASPRAGMVTVVSARQGAVVARGAPLFRIISSRILDDGVAAEQVAIDTLSQQSALAASRLGLDQARLRSERLRLTERLRQLAVDREALGTRIKLQSQRINANEERLKALTALRQNGYVSELTYRNQEENILSLRQDLAVLSQRVAETDFNISQARLELGELAGSERTTALRAASASLDLRRSRTDAEARLETVVTAPSAGRLGAVQAVAGSSVRQGEELAAIVPENDVLGAALFVPSRAAGLIRPGQMVMIRYDAFPYERFGLQKGVIVRISSTALAPDQITGPVRPTEPVYRVWVRLTPLRPRRGAEPIVLKPDMALSAKVVLERRSLLEWALKPLIGQWRERQALS
ncbi:MAG: HlyD family efflux transporter periplasmic adaptor subunit [Caulobacteraceae bacterium]